MIRTLFPILLAGCLPKAPADTDIEPAKNFIELSATGTAPVEAPSQTQTREVLITDATIWTATGVRIEGGWLHFSDGDIVALGDGEPPSIEGEVLSYPGAWVTPGLIDTHSHLGVYPSPWARAHGDGNEATSPTTPGVWAEHSFWPQDPGLQLAAAGGITALQVLPGSANLVGGRGVVLQLVPTRGSRAMRFPGAPETVKMACGENPKRVYGDRGGPSTRMGNVHGHRSAFFAAAEKLKEWEDYEKSIAEGEEAEPPSRDLDSETLMGILDGSFLPQVHCYRADDMLSILQLADEFGFSIRSFHHALEAYKIRDILAEREVSSSTWADWWGFKLEAYDGIPYNAALLTDAGARAIIHSDSAEGIQRLNQEASKAYHWGLQAGIELTEDDALQWITVHPAWALGIEALTGTLEAGKRADVVVWDRHPFSVYSKPIKVWSNGIQSYDAEGDDPVWSDFMTGQEVAR
ncbi:MAG: amidohydrolase [Myxococcota bacterium]|nr:amidohydrolase [Myxococcota bacterium]